MYFSVNFEISIDKTLLTISTFLFAIFAGFFISRQSSRYGEIRKSISAIDGNFSGIYRASGHMGHDFQKDTAVFIKIYYQNILNSHSWDYNFNHKTEILTSIHNIIEKNFGDKNLTGVQNAALSRIMISLNNIQLERKNLVALYEERIPLFEWIPIWFLAGVLIFTLSITIPSYMSVTDSILKGIFGTSIFVIVLLLHQLDSLKLFEGIIGEHSAKDAIDIMEGKR
jgi:hypothetical protein